MDDNRHNPHYLQGVRSFNRHAYFDAHERWEQWWIADGRPVDGFAKGLIQAAVAMHHLTHGNIRGCDKLLTTSRQLLLPYGPSHLGLAIDRLVAEMERCCAAASRAGQPPIDAAELPRIELTGECES